jgi:uncharacterized protein (TIGR04255 family)
MNGLPFALPEKLPVKIDPCPIVEAVFEVRFITTEPWRTLPGKLFERIRDRFPEQNDLQLAQLPEPFRNANPALTYQPLVQFRGPEFLLQLGPRVLGLATSTKDYPGWSAIRSQLGWLIEKLGEADFIQEGERLGVRYIDYFEPNIFGKLKLNIDIGGASLAENEMHIATILRPEPFAARLQLTNSATLGTPMEPKRGSVLDLDVWLDALRFDLFSDGLRQFDAAHVLVKQIFFALLTPSFLESLNPEYE